MASTGKAGYREMMLAGVDQFARTPDTLKALIRRLYFGGAAFWDPCPANPTFDGLAVPWGRHPRVYVNPPFNQMKLWAAKAVEEKPHCHTVVLLPTRTSTLYLATLMLPNAASVVLWLNRIAFPPHKSAIPVPIMTVEFGGAGKALQGFQHLHVRPVAFDHWDLRQLAKTPADHPFKRVLLPAVRKKYGPLQSTQLVSDGRTPKFAPTGTSYVTVVFGPKVSLTAAAEHCRAHPQAVVVLLMMPQFNATYFQQASPLVREVVFVAPSLGFGPDNQRSFLGSVLVVLSARRVTFKRVTAKCPKLYLATWKDGGVLGDLGHSSLSDQRNR